LLIWMQYSGKRLLITYITQSSGIDEWKDLANVTHKSERY